MKIAVDLDGVLYEWDKTARYMLREWRQYPREGPMGQESQSWDYIQDNIKPEDWRWLWTTGIQLGLYRYGHVVKGAQIAIRDLRQAGDDVELVTHRPAAAVPDTLDWLSLFQKPDAGVCFDGIHILTKEEPKSQVQADLLIDDKPANLDEWVGHGRRGILFDRTHNRGEDVAGAPRIEGWKNVVEAIHRSSGVPFRIRLADSAKANGGAAGDSRRVHRDAPVSNR